MTGLCQPDHDPGVMNYHAHTQQRRSGMDPVQPSEKRQKVSSVKIRKAVETDLPSIARCAQAAYAKYARRMGSEPAPMHADYAGQIAKGCIDVATSEARVVGYVVSYAQGRTFHLENVAVLPEYQGRGIGKRLMVHVERRAKKAGYGVVALYTNEAMTENRAMYPNAGYLEVGRRREEGFNRVFFRKRL